MRPDLVFLLDTLLAMRRSEKLPAPGRIFWLVDTLLATRRDLVFLLDTLLAMRRSEKLPAPGRVFLAC